MSVLPKAYGQHRLQKLLDVWLKAWTHGSRKHADTGEHCGVHLYGLLSPKHIQNKHL